MVGTTLLHYRIIRLLGSGGMGDVYAAEDTKLHRTVALKILPPALATDVDRLARFRREAQAIAALNHPNVVTVHSVEEAGGTHFLTMELVEGQTLAAEIRSGGLPLRELLARAVPLVDAVAAAHARGVVHRDLKPSNVMVGAGGRITVLDFGLAQIAAAPISSHGAGTAPEAATITARAVTRAGMIMGTAAYMSPEQIEGRTVDHRTDIFSLGVLLYEMATGARPFAGETPVAVMSSILKDAPPSLTQIRPDLPADLGRIVRRCLAKDPAGRYQSALDLRHDLEDIQAQLTAPSVPTGAHPMHAARRLTVIAAAIVVLGAAGLAYYASAIRDRTAVGRPTTAPTFAQLTWQPAGELFPSLSPDGKWVVYAAEGDGNRDIVLQSTTGQTPIDLTTDSSADDDQPAFSPDGERIAFRSSRDGGGIFVMGRTGEAVRRVTASGFNPAWSPDGRELVFSTVATELKPQNAEQRGQLMIVDAAGGEPRMLYDKPAMLPSWSPHGTRIAFSGRSSGAEGSANIVTVDVAGGNLVPVTDDGFLNWDPVWAPDGAYLYFSSNRGGSMNLWRVPIDEGTGQPRGEPEAIASPASFAAHVSISADGRRLAYSSVLETQNIERLAFDPDRGVVVGEPIPVTTGSRFWANPDPSPDGAWVVFYSQVGPEGDLYVARPDGSGLRQLTADEAIDRVPRWSPAGDWIATFSDRSGDLQVWLVRPDGSGLRRLTDRPSSIAVWSPDGRRLAVTRQNGPDQPSASLLDPFAAVDTHAAIDLPLAPGPYRRFTPNAWSPDGKWIAGQNGFTTLGISVYSVDARSFERLTNVGEWPVWLPDSRHLLFVSRGREFYLLDARTRETRLIYSVDHDTLGPPRLTRDGRVAYYSRRTTQADVWLADLGP